MFKWLKKKFGKKSTTDDYLQKLNESNDTSFTEDTPMSDISTTLSLMAEEHNKKKIDELYELAQEKGYFSIEKYHLEAASPYIYYTDLKNNEEEKKSIADILYKINFDLYTAKKEAINHYLGIPKGMM